MFTYLYTMRALSMINGTIYVCILSALCQVDVELQVKIVIFIVLHIYYI